MDVKVKEILERAKKIIRDRGWTQGESARDKDGKPISQFDSDASCFCVLGAIERSVYDRFRQDNDIDMHRFSDTMDRLAAISILTFRCANDAGSVMIWNDSDVRTKAHVLRAFDKAIEYADS